MDPATTGGGDSQVGRFLKAALDQQGDTYIFDAQTDPNDPNPEEFDCSELVEWAAAQAGVEGIAEASFLQYLQADSAGTLMSVEDALKTPGALLFRFPETPYPGQTTRLDGSHVAISLGDGRTIEARGTLDDVGIFEGATEFGFTHAAYVPGMTYPDPMLTLDELLTEPSAPAEPDPLDVALMNANSVDTDVDMLPDHFETKYSLEPEEPDTDGDGITDGYELIVLGTQADLADTDFDQMSDGLELSLGFDPLVADNPDASVGLLPPEDLLLDTDGDGIADWGEELAGTDRADPDSDDDLVLDGDELMRDTNPLVADT
jgi:hypothetical protein